METNQTFWVLLAVLVNHYKEFEEPQIKAKYKYNKLHYLGIVNYEHSTYCKCSECDRESFGSFLRYVRIR